VVGRPLPEPLPAPPGQPTAAAQAAPPHAGSAPAEWGPCQVAEFGHGVFARRNSHGYMVLGCTLPRRDSGTGREFGCRGSLLRSPRVQRCGTGVKS
jgi:hypothetical protein